MAAGSEGGHDGPQVAVAGAGVESAAIQRAGWSTLVFLAVFGAATPFLVILDGSGILCCPGRAQTTAGYEAAMQRVHAAGVASFLVLATIGYVAGRWAARRWQPATDRSFLVARPFAAWSIRLGLVLALPVFLFFATEALRVDVLGEGSPIFVFAPEIELGSAIVATFAGFGILVLTSFTGVLWNRRLPTLGSVATWLVAVFGCFNAFGLALLAFL